MLAPCSSTVENVQHDGVHVRVLHRARRHVERKRSARAVGRREQLKRGRVETGRRRGKRVADRAEEHSSAVHVGYGDPPSLSTSVTNRDGRRT